VGYILAEVLHRGIHHLTNFYVLFFFMAAASHTEAMDESDDDYNFDTDFS